MRRYEMMVILTDLLDEDAATTRYEWVKERLGGLGASLVDEAWWGKRQFQYEINKRHYGWYGVLDFEATSDVVDELERQLKINDDVVRFKTVRPEIRIRKPA